MKKRLICEIIQYLKEYVEDKNMQYSEPMLNVDDIKTLLFYISYLEQTINVEVLKNERKF